MTTCIPKQHWEDSFRDKYIRIDLGVLIVLALSFYLQNVIPTISKNYVYIKFLTTSQSSERDPKARHQQDYHPSDQ